MSAKSKKRLCKIENKLGNLAKLELKDVVCSICQSILIEPVTLPCTHYFCQRCFNGSVENNALCCPLCRLRIGSWLRTATKQNSLVNLQLWNFIKSKFSHEVDTKLRGDDIDLPEDIPIPRLSAPGEIRSEYEAELQRLRAERLQQEQRHIQETQLLIKKIQQEEQAAQKEYLERLQEDEFLAKQIQNQERKPTARPIERKRRRSLRQTAIQPKLKAPRIDDYLVKAQAPVSLAEDSPMLTDDTSTDGSTPKTVLIRPNSRVSPEMVPSYGNLIKKFIDKKISSTNCWNKENGAKEKDKVEDEEKILPPISKEVSSPVDENKMKKGVIKSLLVSLPLPNSGVLQHKTNALEYKVADTDSVDSMRQELCFFKPIEKTSPTSLKSSRNLPVRVPCIRATHEARPPPRETAPSRAQYIEGLCRLRNLSLKKNLPSAFVIAIKVLSVKKEGATEDHSSNRYRNKKSVTDDDNPTVHHKRGASNRKPIARVPNNTASNSRTNLRRTRSMGSITKDENETTPKKAKIEDRKSNSERKPHLRSDSKKFANKKDLESPPLISKTINNNKVSLAVKNLSSPLKNCDVKKILQEQLRIEKIIEQEKKDLELARQMDAEWNGRRHLRRAPGKRQVTLNYALRPAKKVKV